jgi:hypothetical protein
MTALDDETSIRRFLLGDVSQNQREQIEERLFTHQGLLAMVDAIEDELIDEYVQEKLDAQDIDRFEQSFLITSDRRERLAFARVFQHSLASRLPPASLLDREESKQHIFGFWARMFRPPALAVSLALGVFLLAAVAILLFGIHRSGQQELVTIPASPTPSADPDKEKQIARNEANNNGATPLKDGSQTGRNVNQPPNTGASINGTRTPQNSKPQTARIAEFAFVLTPGAMRSQGEGVKQVSLPVDTKRVRLGLIVENEVAATAGDLEAELQNGDGQTLLRFNKLNSSLSRNGRRLNLVLPTDRLTAGDYQVVLRTSDVGGEISTRYYFRVRDNSNPKQPD